MTNNPIGLSMFTRLVLALATLGLTTGSVLAKATKVEVCHRVPGNSTKYTTIVVVAKTLAAHLAHGDIAGPCASHAETLCNDNNSCTIDEFKPGTEQCEAPEARRLVDCNDDNACTQEICDKTANSGTGACVTTPQTGMACDDNVVCTDDDRCDAAGACVGTGVPGCCTTDAQCDDSNACTQGDSCDTTTGRCSQGTEVICPQDANACTAAPACVPTTGFCSDETPIVCAPRRSNISKNPDFCFKNDGCDSTSGCTYRGDSDCPRCLDSCTDTNTADIDRCIQEESACIAACVGGFSNRECSNACIDDRTCEARANGAHRDCNEQC